MRPSAVVQSLACLLALAVPASAGTILALGDVSPRTSPGRHVPALFAIDARSGARAILSDFDDPRRGPRGVAPWDVAVTRRGRILVLDREAGAYASFGSVFDVDPRSGRRTLLSDLSDPAQGPTGVNPEGIAVAPGGTIYVVDSDAGLRDTDGVVLAIDPRSGARSVVTAFGDPDQGPALSPDPHAIAVHSDGTIYVYDYAALYAVDPRDGRRTVLSVFDDAAQGPVTIQAQALTVTPRGEVLLGDLEFRVGSDENDVHVAGAVLRVDRHDGTRVVVSTFTDPSQGSRVHGPWGLTSTRAGEIYAATSFADDASIIAIDPDDGRRTLVSDLSARHAEWSGFALRLAFHPARLVLCSAARGCTRSLPRLR